VERSLPELTGQQVRSLVVLAEPAHTRLLILKPTAAVRIQDGRQKDQKVREEAGTTGPAHAVPAVHVPDVSPRQSCWTQRSRLVQ
jgi:hypothetical protein